MSSAWDGVAPRLASDSGHLMRGACASGPSAVDVVSLDHHRRQVSAHSFKALSHLHRSEAAAPMPRYTKPGYQAAAPKPAAPKPGDQATAKKPVAPKPGPEKAHPPGQLPHVL